MWRLLDGTDVVDVAEMEENGNIEFVIGGYPICLPPT